MFASLDPLNESSIIAGFGEGIDRSIRETFRMNFVRYKRDARAMQSLMQKAHFHFGLVRIHCGFVSTASRDDGANLPMMI
jgi:hypothetical protein